MAAATSSTTTAGATSNVVSRKQQQQSAMFTQPSFIESFLTSLSQLIFGRVRTRRRRRRQPKRSLIRMIVSTLPTRTRVVTKTATGAKPKRRRHRIFHSQPLTPHNLRHRYRKRRMRTPSGYGYTDGSELDGDEFTACATLADVEYIADSVDCQFKIWRGKTLTKDTTPEGCTNVYNDECKTSSNSSVNEISSMADESESVSQPSSTRISSIEEELAFLRAQIALVVSGGGSLSSITPPPNTPCGPAAPPPPPPPPPPLFDPTPRKLVISRGGKSREILAKGKEKGFDMAAVLAQMGTVKLRKVDPSKSKPPKPAETNDPATLIARALHRKFNGARDKKKSTSSPCKSPSRKISSTSTGSPKSSPSPSSKLSSTFDDVVLPSSSVCKETVAIPIGHQGKEDIRTESSDDWSLKRGRRHRISFCGKEASVLAPISNDKDVVAE